MINDSGKFSIAILILYFGKLPWYFEYFIKSCAFNPTIDVFFISDSEYTKQTPSNFFWIKQTLGDTERKISEKLGFVADIRNGYKLCDFKPAYGFVFSELLKRYHFWACSDIDVIYGDIRSFLTGELLELYDFVSVRHDYTTGCFALYRNNARMNTLFMASKDYKAVFSSPEHFCFDECNFKHKQLAEGKSIFEIKTEIESFTHVVKRAEMNGEIRAHFDFILIEGVPGKIKFNKGKVTFRNKWEGIMYHLIILKQIYQPKKAPTFIPDVFRISPTRIYFN
jgi:hypothetical protein